MLDRGKHAAMMPCLRFLFMVIMTHVLGIATLHADLLDNTVGDFKKARAQALVKEDQLFQKMLENALSQVRSQGNAKELARYEFALTWIRRDLSGLNAHGESHAFVPSSTRVLASTPVPPLPSPADPLGKALAGFKKARGQALMQENTKFLQTLDAMLTKATQQKRQTDVDRINAMIAWLKSDTDEIKVHGDKWALLPATKTELETWLLGTRWSMDKNIDEEGYREFKESGFEAPGKSHPPFKVESERSVRIDWGRANLLNEFNDDFSAMLERGGKKNLWIRLP